MRNITLEELLEAGCHFGHQVNRRNPKADEYIYEARSGVNIIDLGKTREGLIKASEFIKKLSSNGGSIIIVGTKRQAKDIVEEEIKRAKDNGAKNLFFTTSRWIGGVLTNFAEVSKNYKKLADIESIIESNSSEYTKRERVLFTRERDKLLNLYKGVRDMTKVPDALFIVDTHGEKTAVAEGQRVGVSLVGICDTNSDPSIIDYPIPANDDAVGSIKLIVSYIIDAWIEGSKSAELQSDKVAEEKESSTTTTEAVSQEETKKPNKKATKENPKKATKTQKVKSKDQNQNKS